MKKHVLFPAAALAGGAVAFVLRLLQNHTGFDAIGLPVSGNVLPRSKHRSRSPSLRKTPPSCFSPWPAPC